MNSTKNHNSILLDETPILDNKGVVFYSYGYQSFYDHLICYPYYFPTRLVSKIFIKNCYYKKIEEFRKEKFSYIRSHNLSEGVRLAKVNGYKIVKDERYGRSIIEIDKKEIKKIFNPFESDIFYDERKKIASLTGVSFKNIGVTRSWLVGLNVNKSNVDLCVKGKNNFIKFVKNYKKIISSDYFFAPSKDRLSRHVSLMPKSLASLKQKIKKRLWFSFASKNGKNFDLHFIKSENEISVSRIIKDVGRSNIVADIVDCTESYFAPYRFKIEIKTPFEYTKSDTFLITNSRFFSGVFEEGERINFSGVIREVADGSKKYQEVTLEKFFGLRALAM